MLLYKYLQIKKCNKDITCVRKLMIVLNFQYKKIVFSQKWQKKNSMICGCFQKIKIVFEINLKKWYHY